MIALIRNPITRKRLQRFKEYRLAFFSFWLLVVLYGISLCSECICNSSPLYIRFNDRSYFPVLKFYPEDLFLNNGKKTRPDYKKINDSTVFKDNPRNFMIFPPFPVDPFESVDPDTIKLADTVDVVISPVQKIGSVNVTRDTSIVRTTSFDYFLMPFVQGGKRSAAGLKLNTYFKFDERLVQALEMRFENMPAPRTAFSVERRDGMTFKVSLSTFSTRRKAPRTVRLTFSEIESSLQGRHQLRFHSDLAPAGEDNGFWASLPDKDRQMLVDRVQQRFSGPVDSLHFEIDARSYAAEFMKSDIRFPFRPTSGHLLGIDGAGRDVFARILYGLRISMTFGFLLVAGSMILGITAGAVQGYFGGRVDIVCQRFIEVWSALPFLYIMILMGSIYGRSFPLLLFCYGLFNWIGISYYTRAEFLRLRQQPFVEAAKCMGLSSFKIIFKHILPNAMVPVITFFPFSLVGAIGALAALDYLGFGLPPPTPSWGELIFQAQQYRWAWWLILYPSIALFVVMLLGVFVGEGIRNAYDPKRYIRLK